MQSDVNIYAQWTKNADAQAEQITVKFVDNFNETESSTEVKKGEAVAKPADPTYEGWTFEGWSSTLKDDEGNWEYTPVDFNKAVEDEDQDGVVTYYAFYSENQAAADDAANDEDAADDDANATVDDAEESNIASSQTGGAMDDARDGRRWQHRGHLGCRRFASVAHLIISCAVFSLNVLIVKRTGLIPVRYPNLSS